MSAAAPPGASEAEAAPAGPAAGPTARPHALMPSFQLPLPASSLATGEIPRLPVVSAWGEKGLGLGGDMETFKAKDVIM